MPRPILRLGIDVGGTFTDLAYIFRSQFGVHKILSTPESPEIAILQGVTEVLSILGVGDSPGPELDIVHGSTVATNAFIERRGASVTFVATEGHEHIPFTRRQARERIYDLTPASPAPVLTVDRCFGVHERLDAAGRVVTAPEPAAVDELIDRLQNTNCESVAICFLHSYLNPTHEREVACRLRAAGFNVHESSQVLPRIGEFERSSATLLNAYLSPKVDRYLGRLEQGLKPWRLEIMKSSGGLMSVSHARRFGIHTILSGPAGGVAGACRVTRRKRLLTFDMGGTSTDVSLIDGAVSLTGSYRIDEWPVGVDVIDILTIGAGGGSIARFDRGGALRVGPESAGADPGPSCYGTGWDPTVTDAHVALGQIPPGHFLNGRMAIDRDRSIEALSRLAGTRYSWKSVAQAILQVVGSNMMRALRTVSVSRGKDPRRYTLASFGGAGSLHVFHLARGLQLAGLVVPVSPGALSAIGMLGGATLHESEQSVLEEFSPEAFRGLTNVRDSLIGRHERLNTSKELLSHHGVLALRYQGRNDVLEVSYPSTEADEFQSRAALFKFHDAHEERFGYREESEPVQIVSLRLRSHGRTRELKLGRTNTPGAGSIEDRAGLGSIRLHDERWVQAPILDRTRLCIGDHVTGPALIVDATATVFVPSFGSIRVDSRGLLIGKLHDSRQMPPAEAR